MNRIWQHNSSPRAALCHLQHHTAILPIRMPLLHTHLNNASLLLLSPPHSYLYSLCLDAHIAPGGFLHITRAIADAHAATSLALSYYLWTLQNKDFGATPALVSYLVWPTIVALYAVDCTALHTASRDKPGACCAPPACAGVPRRARSLLTLRARIARCRFTLAISALRCAWLPHLRTRHRTMHHFRTLQHLSPALALRGGRLPRHRARSRLHLPRSMAPPHCTCATAALPGGHLAPHRRTCALPPYSHLPPPAPTHARACAPSAASCETSASLTTLATYRPTTTFVFPTCLTVSRRGKGTRTFAWQDEPRLHLRRLARRGAGRTRTHCAHTAYTQKVTAAHNA